MAKLDGLIKVQKHRVDEKQKILARLYREQEEAEKRKQDILTQIESERQVAASLQEDALTQLAFTNYRNNATNRIETLDGVLENIETRIELAQDDIRQAFEALKKTEIVDQNRKDTEKKQRLKKDNAELDEIGIQGHQRKKN